MKNFPIEKDGKEFWVSRSMAASVNVYAFVNMRLCILANKRGSGLPNNVGKWNCISGFLDYDETLEECARREVREESGITLLSDAAPFDVLEFREIDDSPTKDRQVVVVRYSCLHLYSRKEELTDKFAEPNEVEDIRWIPIDELDNYEWTSEKHKQRIIEYAKRYLQ